MAWKGLIAATFSPMLHNGDLDLERIPAYTDWLIGQGCTGVYVCGSTGEGPSLTSLERRKLAEAWIHSAAGRLRVIVQVGHNSLREAQALAQHAATIGADAISATPPSYFALTSEEDLLACISEVASAAPALPFYYYHIPMRTGVVCDVAELLTNGKAAIPTLQGVKFSDYRQFDLQRAVDVAGDRLDIFTGVDEMLLGALSLGVNGAVGTTYNFAAPLYNSVIDAHFNGQTKGARTGQSLAVNMITAVVKTCGSSGFKAMMKLAGFDCGPCRLPLTNPAEEQIAELSRRLDRLDFFKQLFSGKD